jgi:preprotein translocase subunit SecD
MKVSDMSANSPVGSTLAILERTLKVMSAVNARIYYSMKKEFSLLKDIIRDYTDPDYQYDPATGTPGAKQEDYNKVNLVPVADPNAATMAQKVVQYQAVMQLAQTNPDIYDLPVLNRQMLEVLGVKNIDKLIPDEDDVKEANPVTENMNIINGKPVNAEHIAFEYRKQIEEQLGVPLPAPDEVLPEDVEVELSRLVARAGEQLLQKGQAEAQQQQAQQQQQDPLIQMQQAELQIKQQEAQVKAQKTMADIELDKAKLEFDKYKMESGFERDLILEKQKIESQESIVGAKIGAEAQMEQANNQAKAVLKSAELGAQGLSKELDMQLRAEEERLRSNTKVEDTEIQQDE